MKKAYLTPGRETELEINQWYQGISAYKPRCCARLSYLEGRGFMARLCCEEREPETTVTEDDGPVYKDSCLEWFCNFAPEKSTVYINMEVNAAGKMLCRMGEGRQNRQPLPQAMRPQVRAERNDDGWQVEIFVPLATIEAVYGKGEFAPGDVIRANFYKCGDETAHVHYGMWSRCETERPDFHRPEFFGTIEIG